MRPFQSKAVVEDPGFMSTYQDLGRSQGRSLGFPRGGAMDTHIVSLINTLLKNERGSVVLEFCQKGPEITFLDQASMVLGGEMAATLSGVPLRPWTVIHVQAGATLNCGFLRRGTWGYLAVQGGFQVSSYLGSASTHPHLGIGGVEGRPLKEGDTLPLPSLSSESILPSIGVSRRLREEGEGLIRLVKGAQWDWFSEGSKACFLSKYYTVSATSNRVGYRLKGAPLERAEGVERRELVSEGADVGTVQISNDGLPIVLMADAQSIGGYPKLAHVIKVDQGKLAQRAAGLQVFFQMISYEEAAGLMMEKEREIRSFSDAVQMAKKI